MLHFFDNLYVFLHENFLSLWKSSIVIYNMLSYLHAGAYSVPRGRCWYLSNSILSGLFLFVWSLLKGKHEKRKISSLIHRRLKYLMWSNWNQSPKFIGFRKASSVQGNFDFTGIMACILPNHFFRGKGRGPKLENSLHSINKKKTFVRSHVENGFGGHF